MAATSGPKAGVEFGLRAAPVQTDPDELALKCPEPTSDVQGMSDYSFPILRLGVPVRPPENLDANQAAEIASVMHTRLSETKVQEDLARVWGEESLAPSIDPVVPLSDTVVLCPGEVVTQIEIGGKQFEAAVRTVASVCVSETNLPKGARPKHTKIWCRHELRHSGEASAVDLGIEELREYFESIEEQCSESIDKMGELYAESVNETVEKDYTYHRPLTIALRAANTSSRPFSYTLHRLNGVGRSIQAETLLSMKNLHIDEFLRETQKAAEGAKEQFYEVIPGPSYVALFFTFVGEGRIDYAGLTYSDARRYSRALPSRDATLDLSMEIGGYY